MRDVFSANIEYFSHAGLAIVKTAPAREHLSQSGFVPERR